MFSMHISIFKFKFSKVLKLIYFFNKLFFSTSHLIAFYFNVFLSLTQWQNAPALQFIIFIAPFFNNATSYIIN